jgi:hypothetical protein
MAAGVAPCYASRRLRASSAEAKMIDMETGRSTLYAVVSPGAPETNGRRSRDRTGGEVITMFKATLRYGRYLLAALATVAFGIPSN